MEFRPFKTGVATLSKTPRSQSSTHNQNVKYIFIYNTLRVIFLLLFLHSPSFRVRVIKRFRMSFITALTHFGTRLQKPMGGTLEFFPGGSLFLNLHLSASG